jgi:hypothetical protein
METRPACPNSFAASGRGRAYFVSDNGIATCWLCGEDTGGSELGTFRSPIFADGRIYFSEDGQSVVIAPEAIQMLAIIN